MTRLHSVLIALAAVTLLPSLALAEDTSVRTQSSLPEGAVLGYINHIPPESARQRAARHRAIARKRQQPVVVLVHRGAWKLAPENTLEAYAAALDNGADGLEVDIHLSKDGVVYMMHDEDLSRTTECSGKGGDMTYYEILQCKVKGGPNDECRVPTFAAVLQLARERRALLHIDVKDSGMGPTVQKMLAEADMADHVVFVNGVSDAGEIIKGLPVSFLKHKGGFTSDPNDPDMKAIEGILKNEGTMIQTEDPRWTLKGLGREKKVVPLSPALRAYWTIEGVLPPTSSAK